VEATEFMYQCHGWKKARRFVAVRKLVSVETEGLLIPKLTYDSIKVIIAAIDREETDSIMQGDNISPSKSAARAEAKSFLGYGHARVINIQNLFLFSNKTKYSENKKEIMKKLELAKNNLGTAIKTTNSVQFINSYNESNDIWPVIDRLEASVLAMWEKNRDLMPQLNQTGTDVEKAANSVIELVKTKVGKITYTGQIISLAAAIFVGLFLLIFGLFIYRSINRPLSELGKGMDELQEGGDLSKRLKVPALNCSEITKCGRSNCRSFGRETHCWEESGSYAQKTDCLRISNGQCASCRDCKEVYGQATYNEILAVSASFNAFLGQQHSMIKDIDAAVKDLDTTAVQMSTAADEMLAGVQNVSQKSNSVTSAAEKMSTNMTSMAASSNQASANVDTVVAAVEEMNATISEIARNSERARTMTGNAVSQAQNAYDQVNELGRAAEEIGQVTQTINEISEQTKLLALNATIEAARAGEAGKGFAVVASEVKDLARQTAESTDKIRDQIEGIQASTTGTIKEIQEILSVNKELNEIVSAIAAAVEEQSVTTNEIANNVSQVAQGIQDVNDGLAGSSHVSEEIAKDIANVNQAAGDMAQSSSKVNLSSEELAHLAARLKDMVGKFKLGAST
ncbi:MAG: methyl-accepting chemotaxis protein, partial [Deltaproteobacteria bacterium]|nr:methyl-accepting chemotaxis protein [Deltaproteobacteria bacterium]